MKIKPALKQLLKRLVGSVVSYSEELAQGQRDIDLVIAANLARADNFLQLRDPTGYVHFLRECLRPTQFNITEIKRLRASRDRASKRFATLIEILGWGAPVVPLKTACEIALIADRYAGLVQPLEYGDWAGDVGYHFKYGSSFGRKGRLLSTIIRFTRSQCCLELGSGYGMSALFILAAMQNTGTVGHLTTLEGSEPQYSLASGMLKGRHPDMVTCHFGQTQVSLAKIVETMKSVDFLFHDAGHSREDYARDFGVVCGALTNGAVVLFDDIRWEDPRFYAGKARTYEGWLEVVSHPRVEWAVEIDEKMGLLLTT